MYNYKRIKVSSKGPMLSIIGLTTYLPYLIYCRNAVYLGNKGLMGWLLKYRLVIIYIKHR